MLKEHPRPLLAIAAALLTAALGIFTTAVVTTTASARAIGIGGSWPYWMLHAPFASIYWLYVSDHVYLEALRYHRPFSPRTAAVMWYFHEMILNGLAITAIVALVVLGIGTALHRRERTRIAARGPATPTAARAGLHLHVGTATGRLLDAGHTCGVTRGRALTLSGDDAAQNILLLGGTGSGKTVCKIQPLIRDALVQGCGMLVFDVKGDSADAFLTLAAEANRTVTTIGVGKDCRPCNVPHGLTPEMAASFLKSAMLLAGNTGGNAAFWVDHAVELARNVLGVLSFVPEHYSLYGLYQYIFFAEFREELAPTISQLLTQLYLAAPEDAERLGAYALYHEHVFAPIDERTRSGILAQLATVLSPFTLPGLRRAFCEQSATNVDLRRVIDGDAILMRLPLSVYGLGAKTAYTFVKLRFFNVMERRRVEPSWNQSRYVVFVCDEFQEVVSVAKDGLSDLNFWDKSRSTRCVGIISAQGHSSFRAAIGNDALTRALLQNFRQKVVFRTEDDETIKYLVYLLRQIEVERESRSRTRSTSSGTGRSSISASEGTNHNRQMRATIDPQTIRQLRFGEALALLSIGGIAYDDIVRTEPLFVNVVREAPPIARETVRVASAEVTA